MGLFDKWKRKKTDAELLDEVIAWSTKNAQDENMKRYYEGQADKQHQAALSTSYALETEIKEMYAIINNVGSFSHKDGDSLIDRCVEALDLDIKLKPKREYYENVKVNFCTPAKILAMVFEKREEYDNAAAVCLLAIENGFTVDGTSGGMRGRLARMIKKGNLPLTDEFKQALNLQ